MKLVRVYVCFQLIDPPHSRVTPLGSDLPDGTNGHFLIHSLEKKKKKKKKTMAAKVAPWTTTG